MGSRGQGYELNILENERKGGHFEERVDRFYYYSAKFYSPYAGLLFLYETYRFSRLLWDFLKTKGIWS